MLQIKCDILRKFMKKVRMNGTQKISECIFNFAEDGLHIIANSETMHARTNGWLKPIAFEKYEAIGKIGLNDLDNVDKTLERFLGTINITTEGNLLTIKSEGKKVDIELVNIDFIKPEGNNPVLKFDENFTIDNWSVKNAFNDVKVNKDVNITFITEPQLLKFSNDGKYKFLNEVKVPEVKGGSRVKFGDIFIEAIENLDAPKLEISLSSNYPIRVTETEKESVITIIAAPLMEEK